MENKWWLFVARWPDGGVGHTVRFAGPDDESSLTHTHTIEQLNYNAIAQVCQEQCVIEGPFDDELTARWRQAELENK